MDFSLLLTHRSLSVLLSLQESAESRKSAGFRCLKCNTHFSQRGIASHICVSVDQQVSCVTLDPGGLLLSESQQKLLFKRPNKSIMCHKCGDTFGNLEKLRAHLELGHGGGGPAGARLFQCQMCPYSTNIQRSFKLHLCNHHGTDVGPKTYVCEVCGKGYSTRGGLNVHRQSRHIRSRTFPCQHCPKTFYLRRYLDKHLKMHSGVRDYRCDACGHAFKSQSNLEFHRRIHTGYKPYRCELCDVAFAQKNSLNVHMKKHLK